MQEYIDASLKIFRQAPNLIHDTLLIIISDKMEKLDEVYEKCSIYLCIIILSNLKTIMTESIDFHTPFCRHTIFLKNKCEVCVFQKHKVVHNFSLK